MRIWARSDVDSANIGFAHHSTGVNSLTSGLDEPKFAFSRKPLLDCLGRDRNNRRATSRDRTSSVQDWMGIDRM